MRVLVTGSTGTLGYNIVRKLATDYPDHQVIASSRGHHAFFDDLPMVQQKIQDVAATAELDRFVRSLAPDVIVHCAASGVRPAKPAWFDIVHLNVAATLRLFEASCEIENCHFVHVSTGLAYRGQDRPLHEDDPIDTLHPYGASKAAADCLLRAGAEGLKRRLTVVRPFSFTGLHDGGDRLFPALLCAAAEGHPFPMSAGTQHRDFCAVQDIADGICQIFGSAAAASAAETSTTGTSTTGAATTNHGVEVINLGSGMPLSLRALVESVCAELDLHVDLRFGALPFHPYEPAHLVANIDHARSRGWIPRTRLAFAVWQLAQSKFPQLALHRPPEMYEH